MPKWTKATYEMIAQQLRELTQDAEPNGGCGYPPCARSTYEAVARRFAIIFKNDNPRFDQERFLLACKPQQEGQ